MRRTLILILCLLGLIVGVFVGEAFAGTSMNWLSLGGSVGFENPLVLNLGVITLTLGFWCKINIGGVIGLVIFALLAKWITGWLKI